MTEIPEHLLKRSKERRAAMGLPGGEGDAAASAPSENAPAPVAAAAPVAARAAAPAAPTPPPPPKPVPPYIAAAEGRRRVPFWAMPVIALLPVWGMLYYNAVKVPPVKDEALVLGQEEYAACSACHGSVGQGGTGVQLSDGQVLETFKNPKDMMMWIYLGAANGARADGSYGDADRPGGARNINTLSAVMPGHSDMTPEALAAVTRYVRETISGEELPDAEGLANYETEAEAAIKDSKDGILPSAETVKGAAGAAGSATDATTTTVAGG